MASFREHQALAAEALFRGDLAETVLYDGKPVRGIVRRGQTGEPGTGFSRDGSSTGATMRLLLKDIVPQEGDLIVIQEESWAVVREISRSTATVLLEIRSEMSVFA